MSASELHYTWDGQLLGLKIKSMSNHELRCFILGLWRRLNEADRQDFIEELQHYLTRPDEELPPLAQAIAFGEREGLPDKQEEP